MVSVDGRTLPPTGILQRPSGSESSLLLQALETEDHELFDWCVENLPVPTDVPLTYLNALVQNLANRFVSFSDAKVFNWLKTVLYRNAGKFDASSSDILEEIKERLQIRVSHLPLLLQIQGKLQLLKGYEANADMEVVEDEAVSVDEEYAEFSDSEEMALDTEANS
mmetsp:Transcript_24235/g.43098  ORF Transcript_24235/g.43098 Transcript_24235/m.43098 type:complete len:166 (-) Transcript_24235:2403-2900(-)